MQSCASAAKLRAAAQSRNRCQHHGLLRDRHLDRHRIPTISVRHAPRAIRVLLSRRSQYDPAVPPQWLPAHRAMSNLRASPTDHCCVFCQRSQFLSIPPGQLHVFLEDQETPSQLDHPAAPLVHCPPSEPFLRRLLRSRPAAKTSIARYRLFDPANCRDRSHAPACPQFRYQRQSPGYQPDHRMRFSWEPVPTVVHAPFNPLICP